MALAAEPCTREPPATPGQISKTTHPRTHPPFGRPSGSRLLLRLHSSTTSSRCVKSCQVRLRRQSQSPMARVAMRHSAHHHWKSMKSSSPCFLFNVIIILASSQPWPHFASVRPLRVYQHPKSTALPGSATCNMIASIRFHRAKPSFRGCGSTPSEPPILYFTHTPSPW